MTSALHHCRNGWVGRWAAWLVLFAFVVRAVVPSGYMPDFGALRHGMVQITICTAYGAQTLTVEDPAAPKHSSEHGTGKKGCDFGWLPVSALAGALCDVPLWTPRVLAVLMPLTAAIFCSSKILGAQARAPPQV